MRTSATFSAVEKYQICINPKSLKRWASFPVFLFVFNSVALEHLLLSVSPTFPLDFCMFYLKQGLVFLDSLVCVCFPQESHGFPCESRMYSLDLYRVCFYPRKGRLIAGVVVKGQQILRGC